MTTEGGYRNLPRRRFSREFKREVVELLNEQAATVAEVARTYDLHPNQLFRWRAEYGRGAYGPVEVSLASKAVLVPVELAELEDGMAPAAARSAVAQNSYDAPERVQRLRRLRVVLPKGQLHLEDVEPETLRLLIEALK